MIIGQEVDKTKVINVSLGFAELDAMLSDILFVSDPHGDLYGQPNALSSYILDEGLLARVVHACHCCRTLNDVSDRVLFLLRQSNIWNSKVMTSVSFLEALIPHLVNIPKKLDARQVYKAVYKKL